MLRFLLRRTFQAVLTIVGVMLLTFVLFYLIVGDVSASFVGEKATAEVREDWMIKHGLDKPEFLNPQAGWEFWTPQFYDTQFFQHFYRSVTFSGRSYDTDETLWSIIVQRAPYSLAITVPSLGLGLVLALGVAAIVAYWRGTWVDHLGVFLAVLGMCIPFLAYVILIQYATMSWFKGVGFGLENKANIYLPVGIMVIAGLGASVRFYRTIILDQINQDYVRTARAKGVSLPNILSKHVMRNCMLPILTNLVMAIPFLIMGSLVLERFFGIPGLGDLMVNSVNKRDVPVIAGVTFLTAAIYVVGYLITDVLYVVFDPRIRLR